MAKGNTISFECAIPNPEAQNERFMTRDLGDDYSEYVVKADGSLWLIYDDIRSYPAPNNSFTGVVECWAGNPFVENSPNYSYRVEFRDGKLVGKVELDSNENGRMYLIYNPHPIGSEDEQ